MAKRVGASKLALYLFGGKSRGSSFILRFVEGSTSYWTKCTLQPRRNVTNDRSKGRQWWFKNCHFAIQRQFLQVWDKRASPFHIRHVIHQQIDLKATWRDNTALFTTTSWYGLYLLWSANIISFVVFSVSQFPEVIEIPRGLNELTPTIKHCNKL